MEKHVLDIIEKTQRLNGRHLDDSALAYQILIDLQCAGYSIVKSETGQTLKEISPKKTKIGC